MSTDRWAPPTDEQIATLKREHPQGLFALELDGIGTILWSTPSRATWFAFMDSVNQNGESRSETLGALVDGCLVYPKLSEWKAALDAAPGMLGQVAKEVQETATVAIKKAPRRL